MRLRHSSSVVLLLLLTWTVAGCRDSGIDAWSTAFAAMQSSAEGPVSLPNKDGSFKFGVLGDFGTGDRAQYQLTESVQQTTKLDGPRARGKRGSS